MSNEICSFFGHSEIKKTDKLKETLKEVMTYLITKREVAIFYFGGYGEFDELSYQVMTELKNIYPFT